LREIIARKSDLKTLKNSQLSQIDKLELESLVKRLTSDIKKINLTKDQQTLQIAEDRIVI
jgi:ABC-type siderophore export system fused ATPase/permease subunit